MAAVALGTSVITFHFLYGTAFDEATERLAETVDSQARLIEAMVRHHPSADGEQAAETALAAVIDAVRDAHRNFKGFGTTGEFTLARQEGAWIVFLLSHRGQELRDLEPVPMESALAEPMRLALSGHSGTTGALDYDGQTVLAASEPLGDRGLGLVAKIDLAEIQAPFIRAAGLTAVGALALILLGAFLLRKLGAPLIDRLEESERKYRTLFDSATEGVLLLTDRFQECNEQACRLWACSRDDLIGRSIADFSPPEQPDGSESAAAARERTGAALAGEPQFFQWRFRRADSVEIDTDVVMKGIEVGGETVVLISFRDVTASRRAETELRDSRQQLLRAQRVARMGFLQWNLRTGEVVLSAEVERLFGLRQGGPASTQELVTQAVHPDDLEFVRQRLERAIRGAQDYDIDHRVLRPDGEVIWVHAQAELIRDLHGEPEALLGTVVDITCPQAGGSGQEQPRDAAASLSADGIDRCAGRWHRARFQQHPAADPGLHRDVQGRPAG